jgi:hypothetical protein
MVSRLELDISHTHRGSTGSTVLSITAGIYTGGTQAALRLPGGAVYETGSTGAGVLTFPTDAELVERALDREAGVSSSLT